MEKVIEALKAIDHVHMSYEEQIKTCKEAFKILEKELGKASHGSKKIKIVLFQEYIK